MVHRPKCGAELTEASDVEFQDPDPNGVRPVLGLQAVLPEYSERAHDFSRGRMSGLRSIQEIVPVTDVREPTVCQLVAPGRQPVPDLWGRRCGD